MPLTRAWREWQKRFLPAAGTVIFLVGLIARADNEPAGTNHWAFQPPARPRLPAVTNSAWPINPVDWFILANLERQGLTPSAPADRRTLIRRLAYDLVGLPPAPEAVEQFLQDARPDAYERLVERLLASPRYGERWARHWLDVVHFGESHGYDKDKPRANAWPYRDYVVRAFNSDKSYSQFVAEQLAGDVLKPHDAEGIVATGFIAAGPWDFVGHAELPESKTDGLIARYNDRDDMVTTTMSSFLSLTVHCARCHDHKFDPITQDEYYRLQSVFAGIDRADRTFDRDPRDGARRKVLNQHRRLAQARVNLFAEPLKRLSSPEVQELDHQLAGLKKQIDALPAAPQKKSDPLRPEIEITRRDLELASQRLRDTRQRQIESLLAPGMHRDLQRWRDTLAAINQALAALPAPGWVYAAAADFEVQGHFRPAPTPRPVAALLRGDVRRPKRLVTPGTLGFLPGLPAELPVADPSQEGDRRAALAQWLTHPRNFLLRRSLVNRVWQYHFGRGLVDTPNDFGHMGGSPSHPALLDWLAGWFMEKGESIKQLHWLLVTSAAYRQASVVRDQPAQIDADNRWLWRMNRQRLDAESFRDACLAISGQIDFRMGGPSARQFAFKDDHSPVYDYSQFDPASPEGARRSLYRFIVRSVPDPFMECMDSPDPSLLTAKRSTTMTALQVLATLNDPFVLKQSELLARHLQRSETTLPGQIRRLYSLALNRPPKSHEAEHILAYAEKHGLTNTCRVVLNSNEFIFID